MKRTLDYFWMVCSLISIISGCSLYAPKHVTGYTGGSVVLPCYCTGGQEIQRTSVRWFYLSASPHINIWTNPEVDYRYRDHVVISKSTRNVSLHFSRLTQRDEGAYRCEAAGQFRDMSLTVKDPVCILSEAGSKTITGFTGGSVVLPCVCTDVQRKPEQVKWTADPVFSSTVIFPQHEAPPSSPFRNRVQLLNSISPGNLSLSISGLTLSDGGTYRCEVDGQYREITLIVKEVNEVPTSTSTPGEKNTSPGNDKPPDGPDNLTYVFVAIAVALAIIVFGVVLFYCKVKSKRNVHVESGEEKQTSMKEYEEQAADVLTYATVNHSKKEAHSAKYPTVDYSQKATDSMTYSTVNHSKKDADSVVYSTVNHKEKGKNTIKNAKRRNQSEESTEYAAIKLS